MNNKASVSDMTVGELLKGLRRYLPFIAAATAVVLVVVVLPGKPAAPSTQSVGTSTTAPGATGPGGTASGGQAQAGAVGPGGTTLPGAAGSTGTNGTSATGGANGTASGGVSAPGSATLTATTDPACDPTTGRVRMPTLYAPPCVPPFSGSNGGGTYNGVTNNTITVAVAKSNNQAQAAALRAAAADNDSDQQQQDTIQGYIDVMEHHIQTYGRQIKIKYYTSTYNSNDSSSAQNAECQSDATTVAKTIHAFMSADLFAQDCGTNAFQNTLARYGVLCWCTVTVPASYYLQWAPYVWGTGLPDETQGYLMRAEVICNEIAPYPPQFAGEADLNYPVKKSRSFGLIWPGASSIVNTDVYKAGAAFFARQLQKCGVALKENVEFPIVDPNGPADAQTLMAKFKSDGITDVIFVGDFIDPIYLTSAAESQQYKPEWIDTGSALTDQTHSGRLYTQDEWQHAFGVSFLPDRVPPTLSEAWNTWKWSHNGASPPAQYAYGGDYLWALFFTTGISLAGPHLTPYSFQCGEPPYTSQTHSGWLGSSKPVACVGKTYPGMFGYPLSPTNYKARVANAVWSWGSKLWSWDDYNVFDDGTLIWWDPNATGPDETNANGKGMFRYMYNGKRYLYGQFPSGKQPWFNKTNTVTIFSSVPAGDRSKAYPYRCYYMC